MSFGNSLNRLADNGLFPAGNVTVRWGQLMREAGPLAAEMQQLLNDAHLRPLGELGTIHSGVVTRANGFFIVSEVPFDKIPKRLHVTRGDLQRIAVVEDGMGVVHKIERDHLKPVIKGPEQLESAFRIKESANQLFDVRLDKDALNMAAHTGALAYLKRGETVEFKTSEDSLKGGIPAKRSQVKNRRPHWYSLQGIRSSRARIVVPEHIDRRYVFTLVPAANEGVVIDTLYVYEPSCEADAAFIHMGMNSLLSWYQIELRGRSQHGEGVLKVKLPDYRGVRILNPDTVSEGERAALLARFALLEKVATGPSLVELGEPMRDAFERAYLAACGFKDPEHTARRLEQELRALSGERVERKLSVANAKVSRRKTTNAAASIDAYAARLAASTPSYPNPIDFADLSGDVGAIVINGPVFGTISLGTGLFETGLVTVDGDIVAEAGTPLAAELVRAALIINPNLAAIHLPSGKDLEKAHKKWSKAVQLWQEAFDAELDRIASAIHDPRTRDAVRSAALKTLHASQ